MADPIVELSRRARELEPEARARLAEDLLASLEGELPADVDAAWDQALRRRIAEVDADMVKLLPADEVFERARRALR